MKAIVITDDGLALQDIPEPVPGPAEVLVRVRAAALNRADVLMASGWAYGGRGGAGVTAGLEWAGEIAAIGSDVPEFRVGDRVMCSGAGGYAEFAKTDWGRVLPIPSDAMSFEEAATLPVALMTMHDALVTNGRLIAGDSVLVQGASAGVGLMALQIAKHKGAALVIGTSRDAGRRERLAAFGADLALDPDDPDWPKAARAATDDKGVDLIIDQVSGAVANQNLEAAAIRGRIINVGRLGGVSAPFDFDLHALKRIDYVGVTFRTRSVEEVRTIFRLLRDDLWDAVAAGALRLPVDRVYPLAEAAAAQARMAANQHFGKIVLSV